MNKIHLVVIDPQNDFCNQKGSLYVPGADKDMERLASLIERVKGKLSDIHITMDSHHILDVAHPMYWVDSNRNHPAPFTIIEVDDVKNGKWMTSIPGLMKRGIAYVENLKANGRYPLCIWPPHCLIGSWGHNIDENVYKVVSEWETERTKIADYVTKGSNPHTEHYSGVEADVPDPTDPTTMLNTGLITTLEAADIIAISGEALSHCVANTIRDIANQFGPDNIKKFVLLEDCSSSVPGFEKLGEDFVKEMTGKGMQISNSVDYLK